MADIATYPDPQIGWIGCENGLAGPLAALAGPWERKIDSVLNYGSYSGVVSTVSQTMTFADVGGH